MPVGHIMPLADRDDFISLYCNIFIRPLFDVVLFSVPTLATSFYIIYFAYTSRIGLLVGHRLSP